MQSKSLSEFNKAVSDFAKIVPSKVTLLQKKIVLEALKRIVQKTPVDTGRARGNWQVTIATPAAASLITADADGSATIAKGLSVVADLPPFQVVWISNNLEYIEFLEDGSSQQAPTGMVKLTIEELKEMFK